MTLRIGQGWPDYGSIGLASIEILCEGINEFISDFEGLRFERLLFG